jgi:hypothetical protein
VGGKRPAEREVEEVKEGHGKGDVGTNEKIMKLFSSLESKAIYQQKKEESLKVI